LQKNLKLRAFPIVFDMWSYIVKLDEKNPLIYVGLAQENGFDFS
jgi:hypothetical protein